MDKTRDYPMILTVNDLSHQLHIKPATLYAWAAQGKIPCLKIQGLVRFRSEEIAQWIESFHRPTGARVQPRVRSKRSAPDLQAIIARTRGLAYNPRHGETRPRSSPIGKEAADGAV